MPYETILYAVEAGVARITLNRPDKMNCLSGPMRRELLHALRRAPDEARAVLLTGAGAASVQVRIWATRAASPISIWRARCATSMSRCCARFMTARSPRSAR